MNWKTVRRGLSLGSAVFLWLLPSQLSHAQELTSFRSLNFPDRYIRHRLSLGYVERIVARDSLGRRDATFRIVPGLANKCSSFESVNYPGHFLRHQNYRLKLAKETGDALFKQDATFCLVPGLANSRDRSFESVNFPGHYIRHLNFELWLAKSDGSRLFRNDATFTIRPPLTLNEPSRPVIIDNGTDLRPADR